MILSVVLAVGLFIVVRVLARRYVSARLGTTCGALGALLFLIGIGVSPVLLGRASAPASTTSGATAAATPAPGAALRDVSAKCSRGGRPSGEAFGSFDGMLGPAGQVVPDGASVPPKTGYRLVGWAGDRSHEQAAQAACLLVDGRIEPRAVAVIGNVRADVAAATNHDGMRLSGFEITIPSGALGPGRHKIGIAVVSADGSIGTIPGQHTIVAR